MKNRTIDPVLSWIGWTIFLLGTFAAITGNLFLKGLQTDESHISLIILVLFLFGLIKSFRYALFLKQEWRYLDFLASDTDLPNNPYGLSELIKQIRLSGQNSDPPRTLDLLEAYNIKYSSSPKRIHIYSSVLITLGLLGTIVGLINAVGGLDTVIDSVGNSRNDLTSGLRVVIQGMGTAFYTTFFGALFGGVVLRILSTNQLASLSEVTAAGILYIETSAFSSKRTNPTTQLETLHEGINSLRIEFSDALTDLKVAFKNLNSSLSELSSSVNTAHTEVKDFSKTLLSSRLQRIADQLEACASAMKDGGIPPGATPSVLSTDLERE